MSRYGKIRNTPSSDWRPCDAVLERKPGVHIPTRGRKRMLDAISARDRQCLNNAAQIVESQARWFAMYRIGCNNVRTLLAEQNEQAYLAAGAARLAELDRIIAQAGGWSAECAKERKAA